MKNMELRHGSDGGDDTQPILSGSSSDETISKKTHRLIVLALLLLVALPLLISTIVLATEDNSDSNSETEGMYLLLAPKYTALKSHWCVDVFSNNIFNCCQCRSGF
jgi:hypothetical protein